MSNKRTVTCNLQEIMEEIHSAQGLPQKLSTEAQLWDEIMKKETFLMPEQLFPLIHEIHGKEYPRTAKVLPLATEYSIERMDTHEIASIRADITVMVEERDIYHFECEISKDGTMVIRMFEYDVHIAITYAQKGDEGPYVLRFPHSAVLYLQDMGTAPEFLTCPVVFQDGSRHEYRVPVIRVQSYTLEEIQEKHLCVLIPFLPLRFRPELSHTNPQISKDELTDFYQQIILILEQEVAAGYLTENKRKAILSLLSKSMIRVFYRDEKLLEEVLRLTEPILELEFEKVERLERELKKEYEEKLRLQQELEKKLEEQRKESEKKLEEHRKESEEQRKEIEYLQRELSRYRGEQGK